jgi:cytochrome c peroxidase
MAFRVVHAVGAGAMIAIASASLPAQNADGLLLQDARALFAKLPADFGGRDRPLDPARVALGKTLFFDPRWSVDRNVSCSSCHNPALYGADALAKSIGVRGRHHARNAPSVLNIAGDVAANWRGELRDVEHQAMTAALGALSTGHTEHADWIAQLKSIGGYAAMFQRAFPNDPDPINPTNLSLAIGAYERTLVTPAPFDSYLDGNVSALTPQARVGLRMFIDAGCAGCHNGAGVGGAMFRKFGVQADYWLATGSKDIDKGRLGGSLRVQSSEPAERREDGAIFPRWIGGDACRGRPHHGPPAARQEPRRRGGPRHRDFPQFVDRGTTQGVFEHANFAGQRSTLDAVCLRSAPGSSFRRRYLCCDTSADGQHAKGGNVTCSFPAGPNFLRKVQRSKSRRTCRALR